MKYPALLALSFSIPVSTAAAHPTWDYGSMAKAAPGDGANRHGAVPFPADNAWNTDISKAPVDPDSGQSDCLDRRRDRAASRFRQRHL